MLDISLDHPKRETLRLQGNNLRIEHLICKYKRLREMVLRDEVATAPSTDSIVIVPDFAPILATPARLSENPLPYYRSYEPHRSVKARAHNIDNLSAPGSARHRSNSHPASRLVPAAVPKTNACCKASADRRRSCKPCRCHAICQPAWMHKQSSNRCPAQCVC